MQSIENAFNESIHLRAPQPHNEWWGHCCKGNHCIMHYDKIAVTFTEKEEPEVLVRETKANRVYITRAKELIKLWQTENKVTITHSFTECYATC
jgi:hypothetical protein